MHWTIRRQHENLSRRFHQLGMRIMIFRQINSENSQEIFNAGITLKIEGSKGEMFIGYNGLFGYNQETVEEVEKYVILVTKKK